MKVVQINAVCGGSTGKIAVEISKLLDKENIENYILYTGRPADFRNAVHYAGTPEIKLEALKAKILGNYGFNSIHITKKLIAYLERINPEIIHLHNLHGHNVNLEMLFRYIKRSGVTIFWTFHDCWAFTGYCMYFEYAKCDKWKNQCTECGLHGEYSKIFDRSAALYEKKKALFTGIGNMTVITPSKWLAGLVKQSFFGDYPVKVINNGIDINTFKPTKGQFREKYGIRNKRILLGVAMGFGQRKGFKYFLELSKKIDDDTVIVLVGVSKKQIEELPNNIIGIERTTNQTELAEIYTAADVFVNCTLEDNFPTVNLEALACGTPVITFKTGGSVECVADGVGAIVEQGDTDGILECIRSITQNDALSKTCRDFACRHYSSEKCFREYVKLYKV